MSYHDQHDEEKQLNMRMVAERGLCIEINVKTGSTIFDVWSVVIDSKHYTKEEREFLDKCNKDKAKVRVNLSFFLLRFRCRAFASYSEYMEMRKKEGENGGDSPIETEQSYANNRAKWSSNCGHNVIEYIYVFPYVEELGLVARQLC